MSLRGWVVARRGVVKNTAAAIKQTTLSFIAEPPKRRSLAEEKSVSIFRNHFVCRERIVYSGYGRSSAAVDALAASGFGHRADRRCVLRAPSGRRHGRAF